MKEERYQIWKDQLDAFREKTEAFYAGEIDKKEYKGFSGKYGSYAQRGGKANMLRLRITGGMMDKDKLKFVADAAKKHQISLIHLTTCQTVQFHNLTPVQVYEVMEQALDHGIVTMGGGGDYPRNVTMSPLTGVKGGYMDVSPYALAAAEYLMGFIQKEKMPRKLKVSFSDSPANTTHATFRDLGFVARLDGRFDVYSAGGLGANPKLGLKVGEAVEPEKILFYIRAMWEVFLTYGNYENRAKARTRYMQQTLGEEGYVKAFQEKLDQVFASGEHLELSVKCNELSKFGDGSFAEGRRIIPQKQEGLYAVSYHPIGGCVKASKLWELYEEIKDMDQVQIRLSPDESMYIINLTGTEAKKVEEATRDGANSLVEESVACIGASICQVGVRDSQKLLSLIVEAVRKAKLPDKALPRLNISGCPSSCGMHQMGTIGFRGGVKMIDKVPNPSFTVVVNGCDAQGEERMGKEIGVMLEKDIPAFLVELGKKVEQSGKDFEQWMKENEEGFMGMVGKYIVT